MSTIHIKLLWRDRKRILGMPITFTRYSLSEDRLFLSSGLLSVKDEEVLLYRVRDIALSRSLFQRLFGVGTVTVMSSDKSMPTLVLKNVRNPVGVKELIHTSVEEMKIRRKVRIGEISGMGGDHDDCCHHDHDELESDMDDDDLD